MRASADAMVTVRPSKRATRPPVDLGEQIVDVARHEIDERRLGRQRLACR